MATIAQIKKHVNSLMEYLEPLLPIANGHMVEYFTDNLFKNLPQDLRNELKTVGYKNATEIILNNAVDDKTSQLNNYILRLQNFSLYNMKDVCLTCDDLENKLRHWGYENICGLKLSIFVTPKKSHEIEILGKIAVALNTFKKTSHIVDVGDGKGYLSSLLAYHYDMAVLGVDSSSEKTCGALKRAKKMSRVWKTLEKNAFRSVISSKESVDEITNLKNYQQVTHFVTERTDFAELISQNFNENVRHFGLVGLHTCGDLGAVTTTIFNKNENAKTLCNVSCCYNLLTERNPNVKDDNSCFFPLSNFVKESNFILGKNARMLASQSMDRILDGRRTPNRSIFHRSMLQVLFDRLNYPAEMRKVGRKRRDSTAENFLEYVRDVFCDKNDFLSLIEKECEDIFEQYGRYESQHDVYYLLRCWLAPAIESLILLDRLLYLHENGYSNAFLMKVFDPVVSPRCYALVAHKD